MIWDEEMADFQDTKHYHAVSRTPEISGEARLQAELPSDYRPLPPVFL